MCSSGLISDVLDFAAGFLDAGALEGQRLAEVGGKGHRSPTFLCFYAAAGLHEGQQEHGQTSYWSSLGKDGFWLLNFKF